MRERFSRILRAVVLHLAGALMEHFLVGSAQLRQRTFVFVTLLIWVNVPLRHLLNEETIFMS